MVGEATIPLDLFFQNIREVDRKMTTLEHRLEKMDGVMIDPVEFGQLRAEVAAQRRDLDRLASTLEQLANSMDTIRDTLTEARGGWRAVAMVSGIAATVGGGIAWALHHIRFNP